MHCAAQSGREQPDGRSLVAKDPNKVAVIVKNALVPTTSSSGQSTVIAYHVSPREGWGSLVKDSEGSLVVSTMYGKGRHEKQQM